MCVHQVVAGLIEAPTGANLTRKSDVCRSVDGIGVILCATDRHLYIEDRFSRPVALACGVECLIIRRQAIFGAAAIHPIGDDRLQQLFRLCPVIAGGIGAVVGRGLEDTQLGQEGCGRPFVGTSRLVGPSVRQILVGILQILCHLIPYVDIVAILIHIRNQRVHRLLEILQSHEGNRRTKVLNALQHIEPSDETGLRNRLGVEILLLTRFRGKLILDQAGQMHHVIRPGYRIIDSLPLTQDIAVIGREAIGLQQGEV